MFGDLATLVTDPVRGWGFILPLLTAHLLFDFPLQPTRWVEQRRHRGWACRFLYQHAALSALGAYASASLALGVLRAWWLLPLVFVSHLLIDGFKSRTADRCLPFVIDQLAHLAVVLLSAYLLTHQLPNAEPRGTRLWLAATTVLLVWWAEGSFIEKATLQWRAQLRDAEDRGLARGGLWIGRLERSLIILFVLVGRYEAIGFLIAAKSVLRFGEVSRPGQRGEAEYVLVGTLASLLLALLTGLGVKYILGA